jgi:hypothetical protein
MNKIKVTTNKETIDFTIGPRKFFLGPNYSSKYEIIQAFRKVYYKMDTSEYEEECQINQKIEIDGKEVESRKSVLFEVNSSFQIDSDLKLGSKSLLQRYLEFKLVNIEYNETLGAINILFDDLLTDVNEMIGLERGDFNITLTVEELTTKQLLKLFSADIIKDELCANCCNLSYDEIILYQLELINAIASEFDLKDYFVLIDVQRVSKTILEYLKKNERSNLYYMVFCDQKMAVSVEEVVYFKDRTIDFFDDNQLYESIYIHLGLDMPFSEFKKELQVFISENVSDNCKIIDKKL